MYLFQNVYSNLYKYLENVIFLIDTGEVSTWARTKVAVKLYNVWNSCTSVAHNTYSWKQEWNKI